MNKSEADDIGYILEVGLEMPKTLQDTFMSYPLAPESLKIIDEMPSPTCKEMA